MKSTTFLDIPIDTIDVSRGRFYSLHQDLPPGADPALIKSITQFGILHPPIVLKNTSGLFEIICGSRRIAAAQEITGFKSVTCQVFRDLPGKNQLLGIILEDQLLAGPLTSITKARFLKLCLSLLTLEHTKQIIALSHLGSYGQLHRLLPLLTLEKPLIEMMHRGEMSEKIGLELLTVDQKDRQFLAWLFHSLGLNNNKQRQLLEYCRIILSARGGTYHTFFSETFPSYIEGHLENIPQRVNRLLLTLHELSHPMSNEAERLFKEKTASLKLPEHCSVSHSPAFEKDTVSLTLECHNFADLTELWQKIAPIVKK